MPWKRASFHVVETKTERIEVLPLCGEANSLCVDLRGFEPLTSSMPWKRATVALKARLFSYCTKHLTCFEVVCTILAEFAFLSNIQCRIRYTKDSIAIGSIITL